MRARADLRLLRAAVFAAACAALAAAGHLAAAGPGIALWALAAGFAAVFLVAVPLAGRERRSLPAIAAALALGQLALHCLYCLGQHGAAPPDPGAATGPASATGAPGHDGGTHDGGGVLGIAARLLCNDHAAGLTGEKAARIVAASGLDPATGPGVAAPAATAVTGPVPVAHHGGAVADPGGLADAVASLGSAPMLLGHLLAATAAAWLLRRGEAALWRLVRLSAPVARAVAEAVAFVLTAMLRALRRALRLAAGTPAYAPVARPPNHADHATPATTGVVLPHALTRRGPPPGDPHEQLTLAT
ncbi:hypothetical protein [Streptomyces sp. 6N223]|uniref:hypothetical protein n=1 Tax=Streptomyces sp. 6N223 TaxID=3457412 RepID=UPI003FD6686E